MDGETSEADPTLQELKRNVEHHVQEEESEAFPKFRDAVTQDVLQQLADEVRASKEQQQAT